MKSTRVLSLLLLTPVVALAWQVCEVTFPTAAFSIPHLAQAPELNTDPHSATWSHAASAWIVKDCTQQIDYPKPGRRRVKDCTQQIDYPKLKIGRASCRERV